MKTTVYGGREMNATKGRDRKHLWILVCAALLLLCLPLLHASLAGTKAAAESVVVVVPVDPDNPEPGDDPVTFSVKNESNTTIGTLAIPNPVLNYGSTPEFSYVYYGRYGRRRTLYGQHEPSLH